MTDNQGDPPKTAERARPSAMIDVGDKTVVYTNAVAQVSQVYCYDETLSHIAEQHPEFTVFVPSLEHALHDAIKNPTHVVQSNTEIHVGGYKYCSTKHTAGGNRHIVVAVKTVEGTSGLLKTAYFTDAVSGNVILDRRDDE